MITISQHQMKVFSDYLFEDFLARMVATIEADFPAFFGEIPATERREYVLHATQEARKWMILSADDIEEFCRICAVLKLDLSTDHVKWGVAEPILSNPDLTSGVKLSRLEEILPMLKIEFSQTRNHHATI